MSHGLDLAGMHPELRPYAEYALRIADFNKIDVTVSSVARTRTEQQKLRDRYEYGVANGYFGSIVNGVDYRYPANQPGDSAHGYWRVDGQVGALAFDSVVSDEDLDAWNAIRAYVGFYLQANDPVHAELPRWRSYVTPSSLVA
jgi:hypothetical protein